MGLWRSRKIKLSDGSKVTVQDIEGGMETLKSLLDQAIAQRNEALSEAGLLLERLNAANAKLGAFGYAGEF